LSSVSNSGLLRVGDEPVRSAQVAELYKVNPLTSLLPYGYSYKASCVRPG